MRILIISDSHGNSQLALKASDMAEPFNFLIHLGDGGDEATLLGVALDVEVIQLAGNCDVGSNAPRELLWECVGKKLLLVHGDAYGVKSGLERLVNRAREVGADAVLFGHTHRAMITTLSGILVVNPGTLMRAALHKTFAMLEITPQEITADLYDIS
jgi:putative phosphoesterase